MGELGGRAADDRPAQRPRADASIPELVGHAVGRHLSSVRITGGLALMIASVGMLGVFLWGALVPFRYERPTPLIREVCHPNYDPLPVMEGCFVVGQDVLDRRDQAYEDDMNRSNRLLGGLGALTSCIAFVPGWRTWRGPWRQRKRARRRARLVVAAACLSPVAALAILFAAGGLYVAFD